MSSSNRVWSGLTLAVTPDRVRCGWARKVVAREAAAYAWAAGEITGRTVKEVRLVFLSSDPVETGSFPVSPEFGLEARSRIGAARTG